MSQNIMDDSGSVAFEHNNEISQNQCDTDFLVDIAGDAHLEEKLKQLQSELDECRSLVTVAECQKENAIETEQRKCQEEIASIQKIMEEAVSEAIRNTSNHFEKEISHLQKTNEKLKSELTEIKSKGEKPDFSKEGVIAVVTKSLKRVSNISSPLPFVSSGDSSENLEDSMKKAQEDAEVLSSLIVPLEEEIKALKDKLRSTDEQLRNYESAFGTLVKNLGCNSLAEMARGKGPAEVIDHLDEKLNTLSQGLQAEKASRSDLEMYVAVLNTQKTVMQEDMDQIKKEFQEVYDLLEKEKKEHGSLKRTWQMANDQFLEAQRLQTMDMIRIQNVLTSEQQRQIAELKKKDEERVEMERQLQRTEKPEKITNHSLPSVTSPSPKAAKTLPRFHRRVPSNQSRHSTNGNLLSPTTSLKAQSIPANLNVAVDAVSSDKRSLSSSALSKMSNSTQSTPTFLQNASPPEGDDSSVLPVTPNKLPSLTHDQLKALSDLTPELEVRKSLIDNARAETETFSLVGKRLVSETEWQLLEDELKNAREKFGQPCEMCSNYELQLQQVQHQEQEQRQKASAAEQTLENYKKDLQREQEYRKEVEQKFGDAAKECEKKIAELFKRNEELERDHQQQKADFEMHEKRVYDYQDVLNKERESLKIELMRVRQDNMNLLGRHLDKAQQMRNQEIELPNSVEELQFYALQKQEELITIVAAKEDMEENLKSEIQMLKSQMMADQTSKEQLEDTLMQEIDSLREQLGIVESQKTEFELQSEKISEMRQNVASVQDELQKKDENIGELKNKVNNLTCIKTKLEEDLHELKSKVQGLQSELDNSEAVQKDFVKLSQSLQMELEKIRQSDCEVRWQHDEDVLECNSCKKIFQGRKEKTHCNHCGKIFCLDCTSKSVCSGPNQRQFRVCNVCHTLLDRDTAPYFSCEPPQSPS